MNAPAEVEVLDRSTYLGSSDAAGILGLSKYKSALDVWRAKVGELDAEAVDPDREKLFRRGILLEPVIRTMAVEDYDLVLMGSGRRWTDRQYAFMRAEIDFEAYEVIGGIAGDLINCECKSVSPFTAHEWGEQDTDEIPIEYHAQVMYALMVTGRPRAYVFALFGADKLVRYIIDRDEETIEGMRAACVAFWHDHVLARVPPEPQNLDDVEFLFRKVRGRKVMATPEAAAHVEKYRQLGQQITALEAERDLAKLDAVEFLLDACREATGDPEADEDAELVDPDTGRTLATYKLQRGAYLDQKRLKAERPDLHSQLMREHFFRVLRPRDPSAKPKRK